MALAAFALVTLKELKDYTGLVGTGKDDELERAIARASLDVEGEGVRGRRLVYRGPVEDDDNIMASATITNGGSTPAVAGQPNSVGRTIVATKTDADRSITAGVLTVTGTVGGVGGQTEAFDLASGDALHGVKFFTAVSALGLAGVVGAGAGDALKVGTSEGYTEFYSPCGQEIVPIEWPLRNVMQIHEDRARVFGPTTLLVAGTDYQVRTGWTISRKIARLFGSQDLSWAGGRRVVRARMSAGYKGTPEVPQKIKGVCLELAAWHFYHVDTREHGLTSRTDALGTRTISGPPILTQGMRAELADYLRVELEPTAERDFDLEAA